jgi:ParB family transcriptional regulator, chromosome partitioning protein
MTAAMVPVDRLHPHPDNIRTDLGDLTELAASIRARGLLQPLVVTPAGDKFLVLDGHRRLAAARLAGVAALPCLAVKPGDVERDTAVMLAAAMHKALEPIEQAAAFNRLRRRGMTIVEIARRTGYAPSTVSSRLLLAELPAEALEMVAAKTLTVKEATGLAQQMRHTSTGTAHFHTPKTTWFNADHPLASMVANSCGHTDTRIRIGGIGCGKCWEDAIRFNERDKVAHRAAGQAVTR